LHASDIADGLARIIRVDDRDLVSPEGRSDGGLINLDFDRQ
jgi:hypothetical protein